MLTYSTPAASDSTRGRHYPDNSSDDENDFGDYDIAITHDRNAKLKGRHMVEKFFKDVREHKSLSDHKTRSWLGDLPFYMREDAIPLFVDGDDSGDDSKDYQLHPCYTLLELGKTATQPQDEIFRLSIDDIVLEVPNLVIGIGRLFVNVSNGKAGRTSKWTGYEVFVDQELALWMVFDRHSIDPRAANWYPLPCRLSHSNLQDSGDEQRVLSYELKERLFDIACFLPSLRDLADAEFKTASEKVQKTSQSGKMRVGQVERSEIDKLLETELAPQEVESTAIIRKPLPSAVGTADSYDLDEILNELRDAILDAVRDDGRNGQKIADLLDKYKDNFSMIRKVTTKKVVEEAAKDEACGEQIMTILLDQLKDEVCNSISIEVVKAAAGNWQYGARIMEKLLNLCEDVVCENISVAAICVAAENERCGAPILDLLLKANEEKVMKLILEVFRMADKGEVWPAQVRPRLIKRLEKIRYTIGYTVSGGQQLLPKYDKVLPPTLSQPEDLLETRIFQQNRRYP